MIRRPKDRALAVGRAGFTLVEIVTAVMVAGVLGSALMSLLVSQQRFYSRSDDAALAQENLRSSVDLMASELRIAGAWDIMHAASDSIVIRFDLLHAVVCDTMGNGDLAVFAWDSVTSANVPRGFRGTAWSGPYDSAFVYADGFTPSWAADSGARTVCLDRGARPRGAPGAHRFRRASGWPVARMPESGSIVRWYGRLAYRIGPSTSVPGSDAIWRNGQELVTPFERGGELQYVMADGTVRGSVGAASLPDIRAVRVVVSATGHGPFGVRRPVTFDIPLRN